MQLQRPFAAVTPTVDGDVLVVLARAETAFTAGQVHELMGTHSYSGVLKVLNRLAEQGTVRIQRVGRYSTYELNRAHLAADAVVELAHLRRKFLERLRGAFEQWSTPPVYAALFGSAARNEMHLGSDVDLFVVRPDWIEESGSGARLEDWNDSVEQLQSQARSWTGNDVRVLELGQVELEGAVDDDDPVLASVQRDGVTLAGERTFWIEVKRGNRR